MENSTPQYYSYLLRIGREKECEANWRVMLENVQTGEKRHFASLESAFLFLHEQVGESEKPTTQESKPEDA